MAIQFSGHGTREGVIKQIEALKAKPGDVAPEQAAAVKALLLAEIKSISSDFNGVRVEAQGDSHEGGRSIQVTIIPLKLHL